ncbi:AAA family ATPase [Chrysiogenes arsenatis]|uniref:AAA family ATPase n=1 Tax=Chrysiogenes arsenatis TaxID=309797 RepID=UPI00041D147E|nr:ATP-binding protein [Chrysiogenes arsenatis]
MIRKPFHYGGTVGKLHFCNRTIEINELKADLDSGLNLLLYAPRRFGKTSLVLHTLKQTDYQYIFLDFMSIVDEHEFINEYFNAIAKSLNTTADKVVDFFKKILKITPNISVNFDINGAPSFKLNFLHSENKIVLKEVLELPYLYAKHHKKRVVVIFDEFQEVVNLGIEDKLRSVLQHHEDLVSYLFLGSKKSIMTNLFFNSTKPFHKSVKHLPINAIEAQHWQSYIQEGFATHKKTIAPAHIDAILAVSKGFPYYTQQIASELFNGVEKHVADDSVAEAVTALLEKEEDLFLNEWNRLSQQQKKALKFLIHFGGENIYQKEKMETFNFTSSSLKKAVEGLVAKDVIDMKQHCYYLQDPLFELFLKRM